MNDKRMDMNKSSNLRSKKPISSAIQTESLLFVSGQGGLDPETGNIVGTDLESQTVQTLKNIEQILNRAGLGLNDVIKCNIYLNNRNLYDEFNEIYRRFFELPYPSRTTVYCDLNYDLLVEIDAIAVKGGGTPC